MSCRSSSPNRTTFKSLRKLRGPGGCFVQRRATKAGFTLVEILVGSAVLLLILVMLFSMTNHTTDLVRNSSARVDAFQTARAAFDSISQRISGATMNTYWDYYDANNQRRITSGAGNNTATFVPAKYGRASDLHFLVLSNSHYGQAVYFAAPQGVSADATKDQAKGLLNAIGYFVQYGSDASYRPATVSQQRYRYRLMQAVQPTENFQVYASGTTSSWATGANGAQTSAFPLADNVIALLVWPRLSAIEDPNGTTLSSNYQYDSRAISASGPLPIQYAQAPPTVQLTMVVIDEASAVRLDSGATEPAAINNALQGKFTDVTQYQADLSALETALSAAHINYETFTSTVSLRESKWSSQ